MRYVNKLPVSLLCMLLILCLKFSNKTEFCGNVICMHLLSSRSLSWKRSRRPKFPLIANRPPQHHQRPTLIPANNLVAQSALIRLSRQKVPILPGSTIVSIAAVFIHSTLLAEYLGSIKSNFHKLEIISLRGYISSPRSGAEGTFSTLTSFLAQRKR